MMRGGLWALATLLLGLVWLVSPASAAGNNERFCRAEATIRLVMVDVTSGLDSSSQSSLQTGLRVIYGQLEGGDRLIIRTIEAEYTGSRTLFDQCVPHCIDAGTFDNCTEGSLRLERVKFRNAFAASFRSLRDEPPRPTSAILRTVNSAMQSLARNGQPVRLILYSDLIENSDFLSGGELLTARTEDLVRRAMTANIVFDCSDVAITAFGVGRSGAEGPPCAFTGGAAGGDGFLEPVFLIHRLHRPRNSRAAGINPSPARDHGRDCPRGRILRPAVLPASHRAADRGGRWPRRHIPSRSAGGDTPAL